MMIDAGMDQAVHKFFGSGAKSPTGPIATRRARRTQEANLIVVTHEHGDHVAGVIARRHARRSPQDHPHSRAGTHPLALSQMPEIRLTPEAARDYIVVDYESHLPVAPGVVLIKAAGHTPDTRWSMCASGRGASTFSSGDVAWTLANVTQFKLRPVATMRRISEDAQALMHQLRWVKDTMEQEKLLVIPSHDDVSVTDLAAKRLIGEGLALR